MPCSSLGRQTRTLEDVFMRLYDHALCLPVVHVRDHAVVEHGHILEQAIHQLQVAPCGGTPNETVPMFQ